MKDFVKVYLEKKGYQIASNALGIIDVCEKWYMNHTIQDFHEKTNLNEIKIKLHKMNFAKRCCSDDANLCEIVSVVPEQESTSVVFIEDVITSNRFITQYRKQLEKVSAVGTVGAYVSLKNTKYFEAEDGTLSIKGGDITHLQTY